MTQMNKPFDRARETATIPPSHTTVGILHMPPTNMVQHNPQTSVWLFPRLEATKTMFGCNATVPQGRDPGRPRPSQTNSEDFHGVSDTLNLGKPARQPWRNLGEPWTSFRQPRENFRSTGMLRECGGSCVTEKMVQICGLLETQSTFGKLR